MSKRKLTKKVSPKGKKQKIEIILSDDEDIINVSESINCIIINWKQKNFYKLPKIIVNKTNKTFELHTSINYQNESKEDSQLLNVFNFRRPKFYTLYHITLVILYTFNCRA